MKETLERIDKKLEGIQGDLTALLVSDGRKHERIKSLESTRKWALGILAVVLSAVIVGVIIP